jgi:hypothetical protein
MRVLIVRRWIDDSAAVVGYIKKRYTAKLR